MRMIRLLAMLTLLIALSSIGCEFTDLEELPAPEFNPPGGIYNTARTVTITCSEPDTEIRYTTDGTDPLASSTLYTAPVSVVTTTEIRARAYKDGWKKSPVASETYTISNLLGEMLLVEGGTFSSGRGQVTLSDFYLDKYEMTQAGYEAVMGVNPSFFTDVVNGPADRISWYNAIEYCNKRSVQEALTPCYSYDTYGTDPDTWPDGWDTQWINQRNMHCDWAANGYRLPTEMEWMFAAMGGNLTHNYTYSGGNNIYTVAWFSGNAGGTTWPVTSKIANELGFFHMSGNVYEWTWDGYEENYPSGSVTNPHGPDVSDNRVRRGGAYETGVDWCTVTFRYGNDAQYAGYEVGFRVCRNAS